MVDMRRGVIDLDCENCAGNRVCSGIRVRVCEATYGAKVSKLQSRWGGITMTIFSEGRGRVIDVNPSPAFRLLGIAVVGFLVALLLFSSEIGRASCRERV